MIEPAVRPRRRAFLCVVLVLVSGCSSPNRGTWKGTFDGSVSGTVEFRINARGTSLTGKMEGTTQSGAPFHAEMEGEIRGELFRADFEGKSDTDFRPVPFNGSMRGRLGSGKGSGDWDARIRFTQEELRGSWSVDQVKSEE